MEVYRGLEALADPARDTTDVILLGAFHLPHLVLGQFMMVIRLQRIVEKPCADREGRGVGAFGHAGHVGGKAHAHLASGPLAGHFLHAVQLACAAGDHHSAAAEMAEAGTIEAVPQHLEGFLEARPDDAREHRLRNLLHCIDAALAEQRAAVRRVQTGFLYTYAFWMVIGLALLLGWFLMRA